MQRLLLGATILLLATPCARTGGDIRTPVPEPFAGIEEALRETGVPIRLPGELPTDEGPIFVELREVGNDGYRVEVALAEDCRGATACRYLEFEARRLDDRGDPLPGEPVELDRGIQGFFEDFACAASCGDASLRWIEDGVLYAFHLKAGSLEALVRMFRSIETTG